MVSKAPSGEEQQSQALEKDFKYYASIIPNETGKLFLSSDFFLTFI